MSMTPFHALYTARELSTYANSADKLTAAYASSDIEVYPFQVAAAMFALRSPYLKGAILADEGSLGKTYEALLVISQMWFEGKERILLVVPTPLLHQWWGIMLIEQKSTFTARQKVGRGLRLCVNQDGERIEDRNINILHVMANESFAEFADTLQREIEQETGVKFGVLQLSLFSGITYSETVTEEKTVSHEEARIIADYIQKIVTPEANKTETTSISVEEPPIAPALAPVIEKAVAAARMGAVVTADKISEITYTATKEVEKTVTHDDAQALITHFEQKGYISKSGVIKDTMKAALAAGTLVIPERFEAARAKFETVISKANSKIPVQNKGKEVTVRLKKQVLISPEFMALWDKIKGRTAYRVAIDEDMLKTRCTAELARMERVP